MNYWVVMVFHPLYENQYLTCMSEEGATRLATQAMLTDNSNVVRIKKYVFADCQIKEAA